MPGRRPHFTGTFETLFARGSVPGAVLSFFSTRGMESTKPSSTAAASGNFTLEFRVADVDARHARLAAQGVEILKPPTISREARRSMWLRDPDGNVVNLYQEV
ncbi:VOC family protein [Streptomyces sp. NPDC102270]|uniref:VOC family protein n=1 Tax=Streptomyces sp. NPDC102270 TaxID=3366150 RepID=UPI00380BD4AF